MTAQPSSRLHWQRKLSSGKARAKRTRLQFLLPFYERNSAAPVVDASRFHLRSSTRAMASATDKDRTRALLAMPLKGDRTAQTNGSVSERRNQPSASINQTLNTLEPVQGSKVGILHKEERRKNNWMEGSRIGEAQNPGPWVWRPPKARLPGRWGGRGRPPSYAEMLSLGRPPTGRAPQYVEAVEYPSEARWLQWQRQEAPVSWLASIKPEYT